MYMTDWPNNPSNAWAWAMRWVEEAKQGHHWPVKNIMRTAEEFKERFCTDGFWAPGSELVYNMLREAGDMAQAEYENAMPSME